MKKVLIICPRDRDYRELPRIKKQYQIIFDTFTNNFFELLINSLHQKVAIADLNTVVDTIVNFYRHKKIDGVTASSDYPGRIIASLIAQRLGLPGPDPKIDLQCQHKYYSRIVQKKLVPEVVPDFELIDPLVSNPQVKLSCPFFLKPVKSYFSVNANKVTSFEQLPLLIKSSAMPDLFLTPFNQMLKKYHLDEVWGNCLIAETLLTGRQSTLEGYMYQGKCYVMGIVDSLLFENQISFKRFEYPSSLTKTVQKRMITIVRRLMKGIGFDNSIFNIEFMYDAVHDELNIIEINPRMSSQFGDLFERVDGTNSYEVLLDLAVGKEPIFKKNKGSFQFAASCPLRLFEDHEVIQVPSRKNIETIKQLFPDARVEILAQKDKRLSEQRQDGKSFLYAIINLGGNNKEDVLEKFEICKKLLDFKFKPVR